MNQLEEKRYPYLQYPLYKGRLTNGFTVYLLPKPDFNETYGVLTVGYGAQDTQFRSHDESDLLTYPAGIAHFLEHKLFEMADGKDVLQDFSKLGADANAYTSFFQTSYLFSTVEDALPAVRLLMDFVRESSFTDESVEREKKIISQEIEMYQDDSDSRLYNEIVAGLYPESPLEHDIAGSSESLKNITAEMLHENYQAFYQPGNMTLFLTGHFEVESVWAEVQNQSLSKRNQSQPIERQAIPHKPVMPNRHMEMEVATPKLAIGIRGNLEYHNQSLFRFRLSLSLLFSMLFGWTSKRHREWYELGKIDSSFSYHLEIRPEYQFVILTLDTKEPIALSSQLRKAIKNFVSDPDVSEEHLDIVKKKVYGDFIRSLNSLEYTASHFMEFLLDEETIFDLPHNLEEICLSEVLEAGHQFLSSCDMTDFVIFPK